MSSILTANLKHLYQRRGLWLAYALLGCFIAMGIALPLDEPRAGQGHFIGLVVLAFIVGALVATVQVEVLAKPFVFGLPGHRQMVKRFVFSVGIASNLIGCLLFLLYPGVPTGYLPVVLLSAFCAGLVFYLAAVWVTFVSGQPLSFTGFLVLAIVGGLMLNLHILLERAIIEAPLYAIVLGLSASGVTWLWLDDRKLARKNCLRPTIGFCTIFDPEKIRRFHQTKAGMRRWERLKDHPRPWVQTLFLSRMQRQRPFGTTQLIWGSLYTSFAMWVSQWRILLLLTVLLSVFLGYMGSFMLFVVFFGPIMLLLQTRPALYSTLTIAGGRDQRLVSTLVTAIAGSALIGFVVGLAVLLSIPLAYVLPDLRFRSIPLDYEMISLKVFWVLVILPLICTIQVVFFKKPLVMMGTFMTLVYIVVLPLQMGRRPGVSPFSVPSAPSAVALAVLLWSIFVWIVYQIARNRSLVK